VFTFALTTDTLNCTLRSNICDLQFNIIYFCEILKIPLSLDNKMHKYFNIQFYTYNIMPLTYFDPSWIKFREELLTMDIIYLLGINKFNVIELGALMKVI